MATAARAELFLMHGRQTDSPPGSVSRAVLKPGCSFFFFFGCTMRLLSPPPNVATLGERRRADDFRSHPGVGASGAHLGGAVPLSSQPKVCDLQSLVAEVFHLNPLKDED